MALVRPTQKEIQLPEREAQVLRLAGQGLTDKQIALELGISQETVGTYWRRVLLRFGASSRTEVVARSAEIEARSRISAVEAETESLLREIAERTAAQARELAQRNLLEAVTQAANRFIGETKSIRLIFEGLLKALLQLTQSEFGFIGEVLTDDEGTYLKFRALTDVAWSHETKELLRESRESGIDFRNLESLYGHVVTTGEAVLSNAPALDPRAGGVPPGHPTLHAFLGLPVYSEEHLVGVVGVANRPGGYDQSVQEYLEPLIATCGTIIAAYRIETTRRSTERMLHNAVARLHALMDNLTSAVLFEDVGRHVQYVNRAFCALFQVPVEPKMLLGADCEKAAVQSSVLFADPIGFLSRIEELLKNSQPVVDEKITLADGRVFSRDFRPLVVDGQHDGNLWIYTEVTEKARAIEIEEGKRPE